jgi:hypothetical protein
MTQEARISSILVLKQLRASLGTFAEIAARALEEASTEIQRTRRWLEDDQHRFWQAQVQTCTEQFVRAKLALKQREVFDRTLAGTPSSRIDERKALKKAEERLRVAQHKFSCVKVWSQRIDKEMSDYRGATQRLLSAAEVEIPNARARLDKMIESLEAYLALAPPEMPEVAGEKTTVDAGQSAEASAPLPAEQAPAPADPAEKAGPAPETPASHENHET